MMGKGAFPLDHRSSRYCASTSGRSPKGRGIASRSCDPARLGKTIVIVATRVVRVGAESPGWLHVARLSTRWSVPPGRTGWPDKPMRVNVEIRGPTTRGQSLFVVRPTQSDPVDGRGNQRALGL